VKANYPQQYPSIVIAVDNIKEAMKNVTASGGKCPANLWKYAVSILMFRLMTPKAIA